jgi:hypothetical protein
VTRSPGKRVSSCARSPTSSGVTSTLIVRGSLPSCQTISEVEPTAMPLTWIWPGLSMATCAISGRAIETVFARPERGISFD